MDQTILPASAAVRFQSDNTSHEPRVHLRFEDRNQPYQVVGELFRVLLYPVSESAPTDAWQNWLEHLEMYASLAHDTLRNVRGRFVDQVIQRPVAWETVNAFYVAAVNWVNEIVEFAERELEQFHESTAGGRQWYGWWKDELESGRLASPYFDIVERLKEFAHLSDPDSFRRVTENLQEYRIAWRYDQESNEESGSQLAPTPASREERAEELSLAAIPEPVRLVPHNRGYWLQVLLEPSGEWTKPVRLTEGRARPIRVLLDLYRRDPAAFMSLSELNRECHADSSHKRFKEVAGQCQEFALVLDRPGAAGQQGGYRLRFVESPNPPIPPISDSQLNPFLDDH